MLERRTTSFLSCTGACFGCGPPCWMISRATSRAARLARCDVTGLLLFTSRPRGASARGGALLCCGVGVPLCVTQGGTPTGRFLQLCVWGWTCRCSAVGAECSVAGLGIPCHLSSHCSDHNPCSYMIGTSDSYASLWTHSGNNDIWERSSPSGSLAKDLLVSI